MASNHVRLAFEQPIYDLEARLEKLDRLEEKSPETHDEIRRLRLELITLKKR